METGKHNPRFAVWFRRLTILTEILGYEFLEAMQILKDNETQGD
jgi:hypothetical protein